MMVAVDGWLLEKVRSGAWWRRWAQLVVVAVVRGDGKCMFQIFNHVSTAIPQSSPI